MNMWGIILVVDGIIVVTCTLATELALHRHFDKDGNRR